MYSFLKFKFILFIKSAVLSFFSSAGLLFGILGASFFTVFVYGSIVVAKQAVSMMLPAILKNRSILSSLHRIEKFYMRMMFYDSQRAVVRKNPAKLEYASEYLQDDYYLVTQVLEEDKTILKYASESLQKKILDKRCEYYLEYASYPVQKSIIAENPSVFHCASEACKNDKEVVLAAVKVRPWSLYFAGEACKNDKEVVLAAIAKNARMLEYAGEACKNDKEVVLAAIAKDASILRYAGESCKNDKEVVLAAIAKDASMLRYAGEACKNDKEVALAVIEKNYMMFEHLGEACKNDKEVVLTVIEENIYMFQHAGEACKNDKEVVLTVIEENIYMFQHAGEACRSDIDISIALAKKISRCFMEYPQDVPKIAIQEDRSQALAMVKKYGLMLEYVSDELKDDRAVVLAAVTQNARALEFASENIRSDREIVKLAVTHDGYSFLDASRSLRADKEIVEIALNQIGPKKQGRLILRDAIIETQSNKDDVLDMVKRVGLMLNFASKDLKSDREVVLAAIAQDGRSLEFASEPLRSDRDVVLAAVAQNGLSLEFASTLLRSDREVVLAAIAQDGLSLKLASEPLRSDREVVRVAVSQNGYALHFAGDKLKSDKRVVLDALRESGSYSWKEYISALRFASRNLQQDKELQKIALEQNIGYAEHLFYGSDFRPCFEKFKLLEKNYADRMFSSDGSLGVKLKEDESIQDMLVVLSSLPAQESDEDKLNIICAALDESYLVTNLAKSMISICGKTKSDTEADSEPSVLTSSSTDDEKFDFLIDESLILSLASRAGLENFLKEQLQVIICKSIMPGAGAFNEFRLSFKECLALNHNLKYNVSNVLGVDSKVPGLFSGPVLLTEVDKLTDENLLTLLVRLEPDNLFSLKDAILSSNLDDRINRTQGLFLP